MEDVRDRVNGIDAEVKDLKLKGEEITECTAKELKTLKIELKIYKDIVKGYTRKSVRPNFFKYTKKDKKITCL